MAEFIRPDYIVSYNMHINELKRELRITQEGIMPLHKYKSIQHPGTEGIFQNGIFPEFIRDIRGGGGIFPVLPDGSFVAVQRGMDAPRQPGALDIFAGMIQPTVNEIMAKEQGLKVTLKGSKVSLLWTEIEAVPLTRHKGKLTFHVFTPQAEEPVEQASAITQMVGIQKLVASLNKKDYKIEVHRGGFELGTASNGWRIIEVDESGKEVLSINAVLSFEKAGNNQAGSFELTVPGLYNMYNPDTFADIQLNKLLFADLEHGIGDINYFDNAPMDSTVSLNRLVWLFREDTVYVYRAGEQVGKGSVDEVLYKNFDVEGYRQSLAEQVRTGKSDGITPKMKSMAKRKINFPSIGKPIILKPLTELTGYLSALRPRQ